MSEAHHEEYRIRRRGSLVLANETVYDARLSYTALGVLAVLLARPDDAPKGYRTLMRPEAGVGQRAILGAFRELRQAGYRYQFYRTVTAPNGKPSIRTCTYIYETPVSLETAKRDHYNETGSEPVEVEDRRRVMTDEGAEHGAKTAESRASKDTLASVSDAHNSDAHNSDAHKRRAQRKRSAVLPPSDEEINHGAREREPAPAAPVPSSASVVYGISEQQAEVNARGIARVRAALRPARGPVEAVP